MVAFFIGLVVGGVCVLVWNRIDPNKVDKFIAKHEASIREKLGQK